MSIFSLRKTKYSGQVILVLIGFSFIFVISFIPALYAATYYVDATNGSAGNNGLSQTTAWKTIAKVNASSFQPGDQILFKRGEVWKGTRLYVRSSGTADNPIIVDSYGTGDKPIITMRNSIPGWNKENNWTDTGGNIWTVAFSVTPKRVWLSGIEYHIAASAVTVDSTSRWFWGSNIVYVYSTSNPALAYTDVEGARASTDANDYSALLVRLVNYITFRNLDIRGGNRSVDNAGASYIIYENCKIGWDAGYSGILSEYANTTPSSYVTIRNNTIDSGSTLKYTFQDGRGDGIEVIDSLNNSAIYGNVIKNWGHAGINFTARTAGFSIADNEIYGNTISAPDVSYCRGIGIDAMAGGQCTRNKFYGNLIKDTTVRNQINGTANEFYYNVIYNVTNTPARMDVPMAHGVALEGYVGPCHDNKIYNNVFYNLDEPAIWVRYNGLGNIKYNNSIINNIIVNAGRNSRDGYTNIGIIVDANESEIRANTYRNNAIYTAGVTNVISYRGSKKSVASFNANNAANGDVIGGNIQTDPLFVDRGNANFHLSSNSPCRDTGVNVGLMQDYEGTRVPQGSAVDMGVYQYNNTFSPKNLRFTTP